VGVVMVSGAMLDDVGGPAFNALVFRRPLYKEVIPAATLFRCSCCLLIAGGVCRWFTRELETTPHGHAGQGASLRSDYPLRAHPR
jgi:hypothetical protein